MNIDSCIDSFIDSLIGPQFSVGYAQEHFFILGGHFFSCSWPLFFPFSTIFSKRKNQQKAF